MLTFVPRLIFPLFHRRTTRIELLQSHKTHINQFLFRIATARVANFKTKYKYDGKVSLWHMHGMSTLAKLIHFALEKPAALIRCSNCFHWQCKLSFKSQQKRLRRRCSFQTYANTIQIQMRKGEFLFDTRTTTTTTIYLFIYE